MRHALLKSPCLYLVDVQVKAFRLECGWCYASTGLGETEILKADGTTTYPIYIPQNLRQLTQPAMYFFANEPVEFLRMLSHEI